MTPREAKPSSPWGLAPRLGVLVRLLVALVSVVAVDAGPGAALIACHKEHKAAADPASDAPTVRDDSKGLMFTWIDDAGEFHVELDLGSVPPAARAKVRVLDPAHPPSDPKTVYLVDLTARRPDGSYPVTSGSRSDFDGIARQRRLAAAAGAQAQAERPQAPPAIPGLPQRPRAPSTAATAPAIRPTDVGQGPVVIYGASWCGACRQAEAYLRSKNVPFVHKDIEADRGAALEMRGKLAKAHQRSGSIPVIDVRGKILVGFSPPQVDAALQATSPQTL